MKERRRWDEDDKEASIFLLWDKVVRNESVGTNVEHATRVVPHERVSLDMQISEHFIRVPPANKADDIRIDLGQEKDSGSSGM